MISILHPRIVVDLVNKVVRHIETCRKGYISARTIMSVRYLKNNDYRQKDVLTKCGIEVD